MKYYITSGSLSAIIDRPTPIKAIIDSIKNLKPDYLGDIILVDQKGFKLKKNTLLISTKNILEKI